MCRNADLIVAMGTRLAEANSSSWDPRFTFAIPPTRLMHIDIDPAEIGRNFPTEFGVVADIRTRRSMRWSPLPRQRSRAAAAICAGKIALGRKQFAANWSHQRNSD